MKALLAGLTAAAIALGCGAADDVVLTSSATTITRRMIACSAALRGDAELCHAAEQANLNRKLLELLIDSAPQSKVVVLTADDLAGIEQTIASSKGVLANHAKQFELIDELVLRIRRGEDRASVDRIATEAGASVRVLEDFLSMTPTLEAAERGAARDRLLDLEEGSRLMLRRQAIVVRLRAVVSERAAAEQLNQTRAEDTTWRSLVSKADVRVVDPTFRLEMPEGVFDAGTQTVVFP